MPKRPLMAMFERYLNGGVLAGLVALAIAWTAAADAAAGLGPQPRFEPPRGGPTFYETNGFPVPDDEFPVQIVSLGEPPEGLSLEEVERAAIEAATAWSRVPCSSAIVEYAGHREGLEELEDGELPFVFLDPAVTGCMPEAEIGWTALTCGEDFPDKTIFLNAASFEWAESPRPFQPAAVEPTGDEPLIVDIDAVLTHEIGHVLGLSHTEDVLATMYGAYRPDGGQRHLAVDDKFGLCSLYEVSRPPPECRSGRDCPPTQTCEIIDEMALCREFRGELGDACHYDRLVCTEACALPSDLDEYGYCTARCNANGESCPERWECVEGLLGGGKSFCERTFAPEEPTCASGGSKPTSGAPTPLMILLVTVGILRRVTPRASSPR